MAKFYQGLVMAAIVLSAGIIGQIDAADEMSRQQEKYAEAIRYQPIQDQEQNLEGKTAMAHLDERGNQFP